MKFKLRSLNGRSYSTALAAVSVIAVVILIVGTLLYVSQSRILKELISENESLKSRVSELSDEISQLKQQTSEGDNRITVPTDGSTMDEEAAELITGKVSSIVINLLKDRDLSKLANYVHPDKGVRFSPYSYVDTENDVAMTAKEIENSLDNNNERIWGRYDGSGKPIELTFKDYYNRFVYDKDFASAEHIGYNKAFKSGNTINNAREVYPKAVIVEYHIPSFDARYEGIDWESLRLIFEEKSGSWYLTGIIHDEWTI